MRAMWGVYNPSDRITKRKKRVNKNVQQVLSNAFNEPFITYVFGEDNLKELQEWGVKNCILLDKNPEPWDPIKYQYRHKLEAIRYCFEEDGYDEMVHLDWDCLPQKKLSADFWDTLGKKEIFQANLLMYHRRRACWRGQTDCRKIPNDGFVYMRDKQAINGIIDAWEKEKDKSVEPAMARWTDDYSGGWENKEKYWKLFEPEVVNLHRASPYDKKLLVSKDVNFIHYQGGSS
jgi:hypothetical protein